MSAAPRTASASDKDRQSHTARRWRLFRPGETRAAAENLLLIVETTHDELRAAAEARQIDAVDMKLRAIERRLERVTSRAAPKRALSLQQAFSDYAASARRAASSVASIDQDAHATREAMRSSFEAVLSSASTIKDASGRGESFLKLAVAATTILASWIGAWLVASSITTTFVTRTAEAVVENVPAPLRTWIEDTSNLQRMNLGAPHVCTPEVQAIDPLMASSANVGCAEWEVRGWRQDLQAGVRLIPAFDPAVALRHVGGVPVTEHGGRLRFVSYAESGRLTSLCVCGLEGADRMRFVVWYDTQRVAPRVISAEAEGPTGSRCENACRR